MTYDRKLTNRIDRAFRWTYDFVECHGPWGGSHTLDQAVKIEASAERRWRSTAPMAVDWRISPRANAQLWAVREFWRAFRAYRGSVADLQGIREGIREAIIIGASMGRTYARHEASERRSELRAKIAKIDKLRDLDVAIARRGES